MGVQVKSPQTELSNKPFGELVDVNPVAAGIGRKQANPTAGMYLQLHHSLNGHAATIVLGKWNPVGNQQDLQHRIHR